MIEEETLVKIADKIKTKHFKRAAAALNKIEVLDPYVATNFLILALESSAPKDVIELLIDKGASVNPIEGVRVASLNLAVYRFDKLEDGIAHLLISKGADVNYDYGVGTTPGKMLMMTNKNTNGAITHLLKHGLKYDKDFKKYTHPSHYDLLHFFQVYFRVFPYFFSKQASSEFPRILFSYMYKVN